MILTNDQMEQVRSAIEAQAGLDEELMRRCQPMIHMGKFDEAVRSAFVLLEERMRKVVDKPGMTGTQLANFGFSPQNGPLAKHLGRSQSEREGLRELYSGAFKLFRNPTAHGVVDYSAAQGKAIIALVDLMLKMLSRAEELPPPGLFPDNLEAALAKLEEKIGPGATSRLRTFLGKCITEVGLKPTKNAKQWIPFKRYCLYHPSNWDEPKPHRVAVFYVVVTGSTYALYLATSIYATVVGFDVDSLIEALTNLGFRLSGKNQEPYLDLRLHNDQDLFDDVFDLIVSTADQLEETLQ